MPKFGGKEFSYSDKGRAAAKKYKKKLKDRKMKKKKTMRG